MAVGDAVGKIVTQIMRENANNIGNIIAIDGKAIRITGKKGKAHSFLPIITAYATESGVTLSQSAISHWEIESMHWMLDVVWSEYTSGILSENGNKTINSFRKLALLAHKCYISVLFKKPSVKGNVLSALLNDSILLQVIKSL